MRKRILSLALVICLSAGALSACARAVPTGADHPGAVDDSVQLPVYPYTLDEAGEYLRGIPYGEYLAAGEPEGEIFDIREYGAAPAEGDNSVAVNAAVRAASEAGGGTVRVSGGEYLSSTITLLSGVILWIDADSALVSLDYEQNEASDNKLSGGFLYAQDASGIVITGGGAIKGQGASFCEPPEDETKFLPMDPFNLKKYVLEFRKRIKFEKKDSGRVKLLSFVNCSDIEVRGVRLYESAFWTMCFRVCSDVLISDVVIDNDIRVANSDGIDIVSSRNVSVEHCFIATGDDGICIKSNGGYAAFDIEVRGCTVMSLANAFKIGTETIDDVKQVKVSDCDFFKAEITGGYCGIAIESCDGADISDIEISDIRMRNVTSPLLIWLGSRFLDVGEERSVGSISFVTVSDVVAVDTDLPSAITGVEYRNAEYTVSDILIQNFYVVTRDVKEDLNINYFPSELSMSGYPEITRVSHIYFINHELSSYWDLPNYGIYRRYTQNVELYGINIVPRKANKVRTAY